MSVTRSLRVPADLDREIRRELKRSGTKEWSAGVLQLIAEAIQTRRAPGIVFMDTPTGRQAVLGGTGLEVWEIVATWQSLGKDMDRMRAAYDWLSEAQLRAALGYYQLYPRGIDERITREEEWTPGRVARELPFAVRE